jgi:hypothetical protein
VRPEAGRVEDWRGTPKAPLGCIRRFQLPSHVQCPTLPLTRTSRRSSADGEGRLKGYRRRLREASPRTLGAPRIDDRSGLVTSPRGDSVRAPKTDAKGTGGKGECRQAKCRNLPSKSLTGQQRSSRVSPHAVCSAASFRCGLPQFPSCSVPIRPLPHFPPSLRGGEACAGCCEPSRAASVRPASLECPWYSSRSRCGLTSIVWLLSGSAGPKRRHPRKTLRAPRVSSIWRCGRLSY